MITPKWHFLPTQEWLQLAGSAERFAPRLNRLIGTTSSGAMQEQSLH